MKNAAEFLQELWGKKETYTEYETLIAMLDYGQHVLEINRDEFKKIFNDVTH
jgi:hypothetical protein